MLKIFYTIFRNFLHWYLIPLMRFEARFPNYFNEERRYKTVKKLSRIVTRSSHSHTSYYGRENIPEHGNYLLIANHQSKYDAMAVVNGHDKPCTLVMDYENSKLPVVDEVINMLQGKRLKRDDVRQAMGVMLEITEELKAGRRYIIFPEGGYLSDKHNHLFPFKPGSFKCALKAKSDIIPVVLIDTYNVYGTSKFFGRVYNSVYYLEPIPYDHIKDMKTQEIAKLVQDRIAEKIAEVTDLSLEEVLIIPPEGTELI